MFRAGFSFPGKLVCPPQVGRLADENQMLGQSIESRTVRETGAGPPVFLSFAKGRLFELPSMLYLLH